MMGTSEVLERLPLGSSVDKKYKESQDKEKFFCAGCEAIFFSSFFVYGRLGERFCWVLCHLPMFFPCHLLF